MLTSSTQAAAERTVTSCLREPEWDWNNSLNFRVALCSSVIYPVMSHTDCCDVFRGKRSLRQTQPAVVHSHGVWRSGRKSEQQRLEEEYQIRWQASALPHTGAPELILLFFYTVLLQYYTAADSEQRGGVKSCSQFLYVCVCVYRSVSWTPTLPLAPVQPAVMTWRGWVSRTGPGPGPGERAWSGNSLDQEAKWKKKIMFISQ